jgi:hypothetical protein
MLKRRAAVWAVVIFGAVVGMTWLINSESSPVRPYFVHHTAWSALLAMLNFPAYMVAVCLSGNYHAPATWALWLGLLVEWLPIGYLFALLALRAYSVSPAQRGGAA